MLPIFREYLPCVSINQSQLTSSSRRHQVPRRRHQQGAPRGRGHRDRLRAAEVVGARAQLNAAGLQWAVRGRHQDRGLLRRDAGRAQAPVEHRAAA